MTLVTGDDGITVAAADSMAVSVGSTVASGGRVVTTAGSTVIAAMAPPAVKAFKNSEFFILKGYLASTERQDRQVKQQLNS